MALIKTHYIEIDGVLKAYEPDMLDVSAYLGIDPNGRFENDELARYVEAKNPALAEDATIPAQAFMDRGLTPYPGVQRTYSGSKATALLGITRQGLEYTMKKYPLSPDVVHNGFFGWTEEHLKEWHAGVPAPGQYEQK